MPTLTCEIIRDAEAEKIDSALRIDAERHLILREDPWPAFLNRELGRDDLFLYRHLLEGSYVLAAWTVRGKACVELDVFKVAPGHFDTDAPGLQAVKAMVRPHQEKRAEAVKVMENKRSAAEALRVDTALERQAKIKHLKQNGLPGHELLEAGVAFTGEKEGGETLVEMKETMNTNAFLAARSDGPWYDHLKPKKAETVRESGLVLPAGASA